MGLQEDIKIIKEKLIEVENEKSKKTKKFRYPLGKRVSKSQKKKNYVTVLKINENGVANFKKVQISEQTFIDEGIPRLAAAGYVLQEGRKKNPLIILPSWSVEPFSPLDNYKESLINGSNAVGYRLLLNTMKLEGVNAKKPVGNMLKWILGLGLVGIIAYAFISSGGS